MRLDRVRREAKGVGDLLGVETARDLPENLLLTAGEMDSYRRWEWRRFDRGKRDGMPDREFQLCREVHGIPLRPLDRDEFHDSSSLRSISVLVLDDLPNSTRPCTVPSPFPSSTAGLGPRREG
jgi:hypothetical protein